MLLPLVGNKSSSRGKDKPGAHSNKGTHCGCEWTAEQAKPEGMPIYAKAVRLHNSAPHLRCSNSKARKRGEAGGPAQYQDGHWAMALESIPRLCLHHTCRSSGVPATIYNKQNAKAQGMVIASLPQPTGLFF
jgi:hypothetical protein